ncbi:hypothetical protein C0Q70_17418 [Pomacea canaliculata]|uniref:Uncharacterized protein n=1 Tax=Pomacea canaliculata TaxID=400727 RepID=A0A2T7NKD2_POMCA|nr:hypothetical protein C0Q70_17418 [Pomacea canaliculata]
MPRDVHRVLPETRSRVVDRKPHYLPLCTLYTPPSAASWLYLCLAETASGVQSDELTNEQTEMHIHTVGYP